MKNKLVKIMSTVAIAGVAVFGLSACSNETTEIKDVPVSAEGEQAKPTDQAVLAPLTKTAEELKDAQLTAVVGQGINVNVPEADISNWEAQMSDTKVLAFTNGGTVDGALMNPGFTAMNPGKTDVTLTNTVTGEVIKFSVAVA